MTLNLGPQFVRESEYLGRVVEDRDKTVAGRVPLGISYLDDCLGGVYPGDLLLLGAATGVGKTGLAVRAALAGTDAGLRVHGFFLEAFRGEVSSRLYFEELGKRANKQGLDYAGWLRGDWKELDRAYKSEVQEALKPKLDRLQCLYKTGGDFTTTSLQQHLEAIRDETELVVLDHVHVIDTKATQGELRAQGKTVRLLRDLALDAGIPVVVASHLRKKEKGHQKTIMPETDDLHGASDLSKVATQVVLFARDWTGERERPYLSPTFMQVSKDRRGRASHHVAKMNYDMRTGRYEDTYRLGRLVWENREQGWTHISPRKIPSWAKRHSTTEEIPI